MSLFLGLDARIHPLLQTAIFKILHGQQISRASSRATNTLVALVSSYLSLLLQRAAARAQLAGRVGVSLRDVVAALEELGEDVDGMSDWVLNQPNPEPSEFERRDAKDLAGLLTEGLRGEDDAFPLEWGRVPDLEEDSSEDSFSDDEVPSVTPTNPLKRSRSSSPTRAHVPRHLPPFPSTNAPDPEPIHFAPEGPAPSSLPAPLPAVLALPTASFHDTTPYEHSSLATTPYSHLPAANPPLPPVKTATGTARTPQPSSSLISAYHYILTHPPPQNAPPQARRHALSLALLHQTLTAPKASLFGGSAIRALPKQIAPTPTWAYVENGGAPPAMETILQHASVMTGVRGTNVPQTPAEGRLETLAKNVLPPSVYKRITMVSPPVPLQNPNTQADYTYGAPIPAPWNPSVLPPELIEAREELVTELDAKAQAKVLKLPPAVLYESWPHDVSKKFDGPLPGAVGRRGSMML